MANKYVNWENISIKGVKCTEIDWCVDIEDVMDLLGNEPNDKEIEEAIESVESNLPTEYYFPLPHITNDTKEISEFVNNLADTLSDEQGFLVNAFNYKLIGIDGEEYTLTKYPKC